MNYKLRGIEPIDIMRYYVAYYDIEKNIIESVVSKGNFQNKEKAYNSYVNKYMKIGRNFKSKSAAMVLATIENMLVNEGNLGVEELSNRYVRYELVSKPEIKNVKVASSKLLWLYKNETIIMDTNNMKVLKAKDYNEYVIKWKEQFKIKIDEINTVIQKNFFNLDIILDQMWFKMRIFDMYLLAIYIEQRQQI